MKKFKGHDFDKSKPKPTMKEKVGFAIVIMMAIVGLIWSLLILDNTATFSTEWVLNSVVNEAKRYSRISPVYRDRIIPVMVLVIYCKYAVFFVTLVSRNWKGNVEWAKHYEMASVLVGLTIALGFFYMTPLMFGYIYYVPTISDIPRGMSGFGLRLFNGKGGPFFLFLFAGAAGHTMAVNCVFFLQNYAVILKLKI